MVQMFDNDIYACAFFTYDSVNCYKSVLDFYVRLIIIMQENFVLLSIKPPGSSSTVFLSRLLSCTLEPSESRNVTPVISETYQETHS